MPKYKPEIAEQIRQSILDCNIRRLTLAETRQYVTERVGVEMNIQVISRYRAQLRQSAQKWIARLAKSKRARAQLRQSAQKWIARLAKSKRADYITEYRDRIDEIKKCQRELWNIVYDARTAQLQGI